MPHILFTVWSRSLWKRNLLSPLSLLLVNAIAQPKASLLVKSTTWSAINRVVHPSAAMPWYCWCYFHLLGYGCTYPPSYHLSQPLDLPEKVIYDGSVAGIAPAAEIQVPKVIHTHQFTLGYQDFAYQQMPIYWLPLPGLSPPCPPLWLTALVGTYYLIPLSRLPAVSCWYPWHASWSTCLPSPPFFSPPKRVDVLLGSGLFLCFADTEDILLITHS